MEQVTGIIDWLKEAGLKYGLKLVGAIVALIVGLWVIGALTRFMSRMMKKRDVDPSLRTFFRSLVNIFLKAALVISIAGMVGIEMTSFIAILGAAGLAFGLALSGTLQNFAGGCHDPDFQAIQSWRCNRSTGSHWQDQGDTDFQYHHADW